MARYIVAQVVFTGTLWSDGKVNVSESGMKREGYLRKPDYYHHNRAVEGDWDVEQLAYALWVDMEENV